MSKLNEKRETATAIKSSLELLSSKYDDELTTLEVQGTTISNLRQRSNKLKKQIVQIYCEIRELRKIVDNAEQ